MLWALLLLCACHLTHDKHLDGAVTAAAWCNRRVLAFAMR
jgi:hypothetical protein